MSDDITYADGQVALDRRDTLRLTVAGLFSGTVTSGTVQARDDDGDVEPTEIRDWHDLDAVREDLDGDYVLVDDLDDATAGYDEHVGDPDAGWNPIGTFDEQTPAEFSGSFDGNGHEIRHLWIGRPDSESVGLFGAVDGGSITDLSLDTIAVTGGDWVGGLVGSHTSGKIESSTASGTVTGDKYVGGLVGMNRGGEITASTASCDVTISDESSVLGVELGDNAGGLVGWNRGEGNVESCAASGEVTGPANVGGLVGWNSTAWIELSTASGDVTGNKGNVGGLVGRNTQAGTVDSSTARGAVTGGQNVGGLVGKNRDGVIESSTARGAVTGDSEVGGLVGWNEDGGIRSSTASGAVTADDAVGGLIGLLAPGVLQNGYWDVTTSGQDDPVGETDDGDLDGDISGLATEQMLGESAEQTMPALDFEDTWQVVTDPDDYPRLQGYIEPPANESDNTAFDDRTIENDDSVPGFGVTAGIISVGAAACLLGRRLDRTPPDDS